MQRAPVTLGLRLALEYRRGADRIYETVSGDEREEAFRALYATLFARWGCQQWIEASLADFPELHGRIEEVVFLAVHRARDEGADLSTKCETREGPHAGVLRVLPSRFGAEADLRVFLRFNWLQLADLTDPGFAYTGDTSGLADHPTEVRVVLDHYATLWALYTDVRLVARGWPAPAEHADRRAVVAALAEALDTPQARARYERLLDAGALAHDDLVQLSLAMRDAARRRDAKGIRVCALCRFPSADTAPLDNVSDEVRAAIAAEYPTVRGAVCGHCAERMALLALVAGGPQLAASSDKGDAS